MMKYILWGRVIVYGLVLAVALRGLWLIRKQREIDQTRQARTEIPTEVAKCVANQRLTQQTVRFIQTARHLKAGDPIPWDLIHGENAAGSRRPSCPTGGPGAYTFAAAIPEKGKLVITCNTPGHQPTDTADW